MELQALHPTSISGGEREEAKIINKCSKGEVCPQEKETHLKGEEGLKIWTRVTLRSHVGTAVTCVGSVSLESEIGLARAWVRLRIGSKITANVSA